jgi:hypothetical protein
MERRLANTLTEVKTLKPALITFYDQLNDEHTRLTDRRAGAETPAARRVQPRWGSAAPVQHDYRGNSRSRVIAAWGRWL